jgi:activator of 2-hydroxyglutaryl-CoA dehydratase
MWNISRELTITTAICSSLIPLTEQVNRLTTGYGEHTTKKQIGKSEEELQKQMQAVRTFSDDTHMELGLDKCKKKLCLRKEN